VRVAVACREGEDAVLSRFSVDEVKVSGACSFDVIGEDRRSCL
jgi:hypothetical protein